MDNRLPQNEQNIIWSHKPIWGNYEKQEEEA